MHGDFILLESSGSPVKATRLPLGETRGRNEAWLRDTLFRYPELIPIADIDAAYGPLLPLCTELRTSAGPIDIAYINAAGRLTLVECKLWRNSEARRKVIAQILDYARAIRGWSYSDFQRQTSIAAQRHGNVPFEIARSIDADLQEHQFIDRVSRSLRDGRFLLLIAGDGIREDIGGIAELINRNATAGFSFGQVEVALYEFPDGKLVLQPRAITRTQLIERRVILSSAGSLTDEEDVHDAEGDFDAGSLPNAPIRDAEAEWWKPLTEFRFDDPEQDAPKYRWRNHVRAQLPVPGLWLTAFKSSDGRVGVFLTGNKPVLEEAMNSLSEDVLEDLPEGSAIERGRNGVPFIGYARFADEFPNEDAQRQWLGLTLNTFANALRPRLRGDQRA